MTEHMGCSDSTVRRIINNGQLRALRRRARPVASGRLDVRARQGSRLGPTRICAQSIRRSS
jgi:hypothetical protein